MTGVWPPPPVIYGEPLPLFDSNRGADSSPRDTYGLGGRPALREPCRPKAAGGLELVSPGPGQSDFGRIDISTVKDALGSMHWNVDHCPVAMQLKKPAAVDGPYEAGATEIVEGPLGRTTE
jgi:hypothetical protein